MYGLTLVPLTADWGCISASSSPKTAAGSAAPTRPGTHHHHHCHASSLYTCWYRDITICCTAVNPHLLVSFAGSGRKVKFSFLTTHSNMRFGRKPTVTVSSSSWTFGIRSWQHPSGSLWVQSDCVLTTDSGMAATWVRTRPLPVILWINYINVGRNRQILCYIQCFSG